MLDTRWKSLHCFREPRDHFGHKNDGKLASHVTVGRQGLRSIQEVFNCANDWVVGKIMYPGYLFD